MEDCNSKSIKILVRDEQICVVDIFVSEFAATGKCSLYENYKRYLFSFSVRLERLEEICIVLTDCNAYAHKGYNFDR